MRWIYFALFVCSKLNHERFCSLNVFLYLHCIYVLSYHYVMDKLLET